MRVLRDIERDMKQANLGGRRPGTAKDRKSFYTGGQGHVQGDIPAYLKRIRREEDEERQRTKFEIEMNKRPMGTRVIRPDEHQKTVSEL